MADQHNPEPAQADLYRHHEGKPQSLVPIIENDNGTLEIVVNRDHLRPQLVHVEIVEFRGEGEDREAIRVTAGPFALAELTAFVHDALNSERSASGLTDPDGYVLVIERLSTSEVGVRVVPSPGAREVGVKTASFGPVTREVLRDLLRHRVLTQPEPDMPEQEHEKVPGLILPEGSAAPAYGGGVEPNIEDPHAAMPDPDTRVPKRRLGKLERRVDAMAEATASRLDGIEKELKRLTDERRGEEGGITTAEAERLAEARLANAAARYEDVRLHERDRAASELEDWITQREQERAPEVHAQRFDVVRQAFDMVHGLAAGEPGEGGFMAALFGTPGKPGQAPRINETLKVARFVADGHRHIPGVDQ